MVRISENIVDAVISEGLSDEECLAKINKKIRDCVASEYPEIVGWFRNKYFNSERFYETDTQIFVHAGVDEGSRKKLTSILIPIFFSNKIPSKYRIFLWRYYFGTHCFFRGRKMTQTILGKSTNAKKSLFY